MGTSPRFKITVDGIHPISNCNAVFDTFHSVFGVEGAFSRIRDDAGRLGLVYDRGDVKLTESPFFGLDPKTGGFRFRAALEFTREHVCQADTWLELLRSEVIDLTVVAHGTTLPSHNPETTASA